jgi:hypothetical protein
MNSFEYQLGSVVLTNNHVGVVGYIGSPLPEHVELIRKLAPEFNPSIHNIIGLELTESEVETSWRAICVTQYFQPRLGKEFGIMIPDFRIRQQTDSFSVLNRLTSLHHKVQYLETYIQALERKNKKMEDIIRNGQHLPQTIELDYEVEISLNYVGNHCQEPPTHSNVSSISFTGSNLLNEEFSKKRYSTMVQCSPRPSIEGRLPLTRIYQSPQTSNFQSNGLCIEGEDCELPHLPKKYNVYL